MDLLKSFLCIICLFGQRHNKASLQAVNVAVGVTGGSVVLPCVTSETQHKLSDITVHWRHNGSLIVFDILNGNGSVEHQNSGYKNRTETFPTEYKKGNFSLKLNSLTHTDAGNYECFIMHTSEQVTLNRQLIINESAVHNGEQPTEENKNSAPETRLWMISTPVLVVLICLVICITWKIRCKKPSRPEVPPPDGDLCYTDLCHNNTEVHQNGNGSQSD